MKKLLLLLLTPLLLLSTAAAAPLSGKELWKGIYGHFNAGIDKMTNHREYTPVTHEMLEVAVKKVQRINPDKAWYDGFLYEKHIWDCDMQAMAVIGVFKAFYYDIRPAIGFMTFRSVHYKYGHPDYINHAVLFYYDHSGQMFLFETVYPGLLKHVPVEFGDEPGTIMYKGQTVKIHTLLF